MKSLVKKFAPETSYLCRETKLGTGIAMQKTVFMKNYCYEMMGMTKTPEEMVLSQRKQVISLGGWSCL